MHLVQSSACRYCDHQTESVDHLLHDCPALVCVERIKVSLLLGNRSISFRGVGLQPAGLVALRALARFPGAWELSFRSPWGARLVSRCLSVSQVGDADANR